MKTSKSYYRKVVIGRAEIVHFLEFEVADVPAKVDTGAYRSAVHADNIELQEDGTLSFRLLGGHPIYKGVAQTVTTPNFKKVWITNSFGTREERYEVKLKIKLGPKIFWANFSLADRSKMLYPILLGRTLMNGRFIVDPSQRAVNRLELKKEYGIVLPADEEDTEQ
jgi:hypothetical protein